MLHSRQGSLRAVAVVTKPFAGTTKTVEEARHLALPVIAGGVIIAVLYFGRLFFITSLAAIILAFILEPFVGLLMRAHFPRALAAFVVCTLALLILYVIGLGAYSQLSSLYDDLPKYSQRIADIEDNVQQKLQDMEERTYKLVVPARQRQEEAQREQIRQQQQQAQEQSRRRRRAQQQPVVPAVPPGPAAIPEVRIHEERTPIGDYIYSRLSSFYQIL
ncbi:MAG TPA: AI-2E family transporter, partial [Bryobacteraceae bacterium]|nr:AI-2E family transporter [Bryobacteraceae bacterium]